MENLYLNLEFDKFKNRLEKELINLNTYKNKVEGYDDIEKLKIDHKEFLKGIEKFLDSAFNKPNNYFYREFKITGTNHFKIPGTQINITHLKRQIKEEYSKKIIQLKKTINLISICELIKNNNSNKPNLKTIRQKQEFILNKLYELNDTWLYDIQLIFIGNGIQEKRKDEFADIVLDLESQGLLNVSYTSQGLYGCLTIEGTKYVEEFIQLKIELEIQRNEIIRNSREIAKDSLSESVKENLKKEIREGVENTLDKLESLINSNEVKGDLNRIWGRYASLKRKINRGIIHEQDAILEENRIINALIDLIDDLKESDIKIDIEK